MSNRIVCRGDGNLTDSRLIAHMEQVFVSFNEQDAKALYVVRDDQDNYGVFDLVFIWWLDTANGPEDAIDKYERLLQEIAEDY